MRAPGSRDALLARMEQAVLTDPVPTLQPIRAPTLLLWGEQDAMDLHLVNRIVLAPLTRNRSPGAVPTELGVTY